MKNKIITVSFILLLMLSVFIMFFAPSDIDKIQEKENRPPASMPKLSRESFLSGDFESGFENFLNDKIGYRFFLNSLSERISSARGISTPAGKIVVTDKDSGTGETMKSGLIMVNNTIMEIFIKNKELEDKYIETLNGYREKLDKNIKMYSMLIPTQLEFQEAMYSNIQDSQKETIDYIYENLDDGIENVDAYGYLNGHSDEYIYFRTDHHWTMLGAYYGYRAFIDREGGDSVNVNDFEKNNITGFLGYLYNQSQMIEAAEYPDNIEWYDVEKNNEFELSMTGFTNGNVPRYYKGKLFDKTKANYDFFLGSDHPLVSITNKNRSDGKTIVIVRDSYANAFAPWIINSYKHVVLVDPRTFKQNLQTVIDMYKPDELLVMNYIFTTIFSDYCNVLTNIY